MTKLDSILKSIDITLPTKCHTVKAMVFPVVMHGCEKWTIKKAEHQGIDAYELWFWRILLSLRIVVLENTLESPLDGKEIKSVNLDGN